MVAVAGDTDTVVPSELFAPPNDCTTPIAAAARVMKPSGRAAAAKSPTSANPAMAAGNQAHSL